MLVFLFGLYPFLGALFQPDLADGEEEAINQDIVELQKGLHQQVKFLEFSLF